MKAILTSIFAVVLGLMVGSGINMGVIELGSFIIPPPSGVDVSNVESINKSIDLYQPKHFLAPFLAHALGTLAGALIAFVVGSGQRLHCAYAVGVLFLAGGIAAAIMIAAPVWFIVLDLVVAYLPMAWLGARLGKQFKSDG